MKGGIGRRLTARLARGTAGAATRAARASLSQPTADAAKARRRTRASPSLPSRAPRVLCCQHAQARRDEGAARMGAQGRAPAARTPTSTSIDGGERDADADANANLTSPSFEIRIESTRTRPCFPRAPRRMPPPRGRAARTTPHVDRRALPRS